MNEPKYEAYEVVTMFGRYTGAWQEYGQRIAARHQIINLWMGSSTALIVYFAKEDLTKDIGIATALALPALAIAMFAMLLLHDLMMQRLSDYMFTCELHNNRHASVAGQTPLPSYRADSKFSDGFLGTRSLQNHVLCVVSVALWLATLFIDQHRTTSQTAHSALNSGHLGVLPAWTQPALFILWVAAIAINYFAIFYRFIQCRKRERDRDKAEAHRPI
ncbi:hypothetical protein [Verrucomicrobium sp. BvORR034]|uniref:hypothetical protein n=1 Tax=Verrucomicrobium sp. BvORR034 TaxID=1396418 RepID=UPI0006799F97|nr:hypothetical protein [Verrucomicrobium sp. BvORR034]